MADNTIQKEPKEILADTSIRKVCIDTSVVLAYYNNQDPNHKEAVAAIEALRAYNYTFVFPTMIFAELIARRKNLGEKTITVTASIKIFNRFLKHLGRTLVGGAPMHTQTVVERFARYSRKHVFSTQRFNDFWILSEVEKIPDILVVTGDKDMHDAGKTIFRKRIYFLPRNTKGKQGELERLIRDIAPTV